MAYSFLGTASFERDYDEALAYIVYDLRSPQAAKNLIEQMEESIKRISENPFINAVSQKPTLASIEYREEFVGNYVLLYKVEDEAIVAKRLFHMTQDYQNYV